MPTHKHIHARASGHSETLAHARARRYTCTRIHINTHAHTILIYLTCSWGMEGAEEFGEFEVNVGGLLVPEHEQVRA